MRPGMVHEAESCLRGGIGGSGEISEKLRAGSLRDEGEVCVSRIYLEYRLGREKTILAVATLQ